jgi:diguanylate cyclase (GGDEF)-like protein
MDIRVALARMGAVRDHARGSAHAYPTAVRQFNALLGAAQAQYPNREDILAFEPFPNPGSTFADELGNTVRRLQDALDSESATPSEGARMHQKFGILRAESQLSVDFDGSAELQAGVALIFLDVDDFKSLNTAYTETVVDRDFLAPFQRFLAEAVRHRGYCYCVGGDEFIILLLNCGRRESVAFAERLVETVRESTFECAGDPIHVRVSLGVANSPKDGTGLQAVREKANHAERRAKSKGKNQVVTYE